MEELQARHRKELKDLQARITQKKKSATKKTRKGVNDECDRLEVETKERQAAELASISGEPTSENGQDQAGDPDDLEDGMAAVSVSEELDKPQISSTDGRPSSSETQPAADAPESAFHKKPNRAKARLARRAAEQEALFNQASREASDLPNLKAQERDRMVAEFKKRGLVEKEIRADGHCLYSAFADQMDGLGLPLGNEPDIKSGIFKTLGNSYRKEKEEAKFEGYRAVRKAAAKYIENHPDDFVPFLEEPLPQYVHKVRDTGEWGGQLELLALARTYGVQINVLQGNGRVEEILPDDQKERENKMWLAYYKYGFGLGEHYNSLKKAG